MRFACKRTGVRFPAKKGFCLGLLQTNSCGVIDNTYSGDGDVWMVPMLATRDTVVEVGDRICQFRIMKNQPQIVFDEVEHLDGADRGGFGTTGKR